jgi:hypothetical protein
MKKNRFIFFFKKIHHSFSIFTNVFSQYVKRPFLHQDKAFLSLRNSQIGKRCFIVALGPSLVLDDLNKLKNEYTFSMNSIIRSFDKTDWRPTYYAVTDKRIIDKYKDDKRLEEARIFFTSSFSFPKRNYRKNQIVYTASNASQARCVMRGNFKNGVHISKRLNRYINDSPTSVQSLIQIAIFMGFKEIYLLGQDCNYGGANAHASIAGASSVVNPTEFEQRSMLDTFETFRHDADKMGIKIVNCTRGGALEAFERKSLDDVLQQK